ANGTAGIIGTSTAGLTVSGVSISGVSGSGILLNSATGSISITSNIISSGSDAVLVTAGAAGLNLAFNNNTLTSTLGAGAFFGGSGGSLLTIRSLSGNTVLAAPGGTGDGGILVSTATFDADAAA